MKCSAAIRSIILFSLPVILSRQVCAQPKIVAVVNAATWKAGLPVGGALASALVSGLTALKPGTYVAPPLQPLPHMLGGVTVWINADFAPLLAVVVPSDPSASVQINFQVPPSADASLLSYQFVSLFPRADIGPAYAGYIAVSDGMNLAVQNGTGKWPQTSPGTGTLTWGGFFADANGNAIALHTSDYSLVTPQNPAHSGESIMIYADDFFSTWPPPPIGVPAPDAASQRGYEIVRSPGNLYLQTDPRLTTCTSPNCIANPTIVSATNTPALKITFMGLAPGLVGVEQINFVVPSNQQPGNWPLFFNLGSCADGSGVPGTCGARFGDSSYHVLLPVD